MTFAPNSNIMLLCLAVDFKGSNHDDDVFKSAVQTNGEEKTCFYNLVNSRRLQQFEMPV